MIMIMQIAFYLWMALVILWLLFFIVLLLLILALLLSLVIRPRKTIDFIASLRRPVK